MDSLNASCSICLFKDESRLSKILCLYKLHFVWYFGLN
uniref:Uncharacterized protein n=1 Tax=Anguilla anguilla TaxID=7936 RepID=A0A0E9R2E7_ANGAN